jgi:hypothetical protein
LLILFSCVPFICGLANIAPTLEYSRQTGTNYSLNYLFPLLIAGIIFSIGFLLVIVPVIRNRKVTK